LRAIVDAVKPLHTEVDLRVIVPGSRIELATTIGFDFILGDGGPRTPPPPLGGRSVASSRPAPVLGVDAVLGDGAARAGPRLGDGTGATIGNLDLS
jgi:hypothetical protein